MAKKPLLGGKAVKPKTKTSRNASSITQQLAQREAELAIINSIQAGLASKLEIQAIYDLIGDKIRDIFKAETVAVNYYDQDRDLISTPYLWSQEKRLPNEEPLPLSDAPLRKFLIESRKPWIVNHDAETIPESLNAKPDESLGRWPRSGIVAPILASNKVIGIIQIANMEQGNAFTHADLHLLETIANSMSVALENARLFDETQQRNAELAIINSVQEGLASKLDVQAIYELVGEKIRATFNAQVVSIDTSDGDTQTLRGRYYYEAGRVLAGATYPCFGFRRHVIENRQPIIIHKDMLRWMVEYDNPVFQGVQPRSAIFIPMIVGEEALGVISLQNNDQENAFTETDIRLLTTLSNSMSVALENARLWEKEKLYRKALERELEIGREIQAGFLPEALPRVEGWEFAATLMSAREVAGDFYDAFELPDGNIGLVIADVCDKGVGAALFMTLFRSLLRITANQEYFEHMETPSHSAAERLQRAMLVTNNYIAETHQDSGMFATIFFGILDPGVGRLTYINGGHEPPFILQSGNVRECLRKTGPAIGAILDGQFNVQVVELNPGEVFFAFTDGAPEAKDPHDEFFGRMRLLNILQRHDGSADELVKSIRDELHQYIGSATQFDDITLLAVRRYINKS